MVKSKVSKAAKIREQFEKNPQARPKDVIAALAALNITVAPAQVSNIRATLGQRKPRRTLGRKDPIALEELLAAKRLIQSIGSIARAREALEALAKLR